MAATVSFFGKFQENSKRDGCFRLKARKKDGFCPMNLVPLPQAGRCNGGLWVMIMVRWGRFRPVSQRGAGPGGPCPKAGYGPLNRNTSPRD